MTGKQIALVLFIISAARLTACSPKSGESAASDTTVSKKRIIPHALVGVSFKGLDNARVTNLSPARAKAKKEEIDAKLKETGLEEGHREWFFHAFDDAYLYFFIARYHVRCTNKLGCLDYIAEEIYRVPRSKKTEEDLGVKKEVDLYEVGMRGVKGGMTEDEVIEILGEPKDKGILQLEGSFRLIYPDLWITFYHYEVIGIHEVEEQDQ